VTPQIDRATGDVRVRIAVREGPRWQVNALQFEIADGSEAPAEIAGARTGRPWTSLWRQDTTDRHPPLVFHARPSGRADQAGGADPPRGGRHQSRDRGGAGRPGPEVRVGRVRFTGNARTRDATLRRLVPASRAPC
jgi:outer membrane protein assembly factor BamA